MSEVQSSAREIRQRLWNPPNGRHSSELDVVSEATITARRAEENARRRAAAKEQALLDSIERAKLAAVLRKLEIEALREQQRTARGDYDTLPPSVTEMLKAVCRHYGVKYIDMVSGRRTVSIVRPRQVVMYLAREHTTLSLPAIGRRLGGRDHTTVLHGHTKVKRLLASGDEQLSTDITAIKAAMGLE